MANRRSKPVICKRDSAFNSARIARLNNGERYEDRSVKSGLREVAVHEECQGNGDWWVEYFDDDGGCYVTIIFTPLSRND